MNDDDKNWRQDLVNAVSGAFMLLALVVHPFLTLIVLIGWAMSTAASAPRTPQRCAAEAQRRAERQRRRERKAYVATLNWRERQAYEWSASHGADKGTSR